MSVQDRAAKAIAFVGSARILITALILLLLLVLSAWINIIQWSDHRAYVKNEKERLELAASKAALKITGQIALAKPKDDADMREAIGRIEAKVKGLRNAPRPPALPAQCAPGQRRIDDVNAGADK